MKREGASTLFIHGFPWVLSYLLDHLLLFEIMLCGVGFESILKMQLRNDSRLYKNAYKSVCFKNDSKQMFVRCVFQSDFEKVSL